MYLNAQNKRVSMFIATSTFRVRNNDSYNIAIKLAFNSTLTLALNITITLTITIMFHSTIAISPEINVTIRHARSLHLYLNLKRNLNMSHYTNVYSCMCSES